MFTVFRGWVLKMRAETLSAFLSFQSPIWRAKHVVSPLMSLVYSEISFINNWSYNVPSFSRTRWTVLTLILKGTYYDRNMLLPLCIQCLHTLYIAMINNTLYFVKGLAKHCLTQTCGPVEHLLWEVWQATTLLQENKQSCLKTSPVFQASS